MARDFKEFEEFIKEKKVGVVGVGVSNIPLIFFLNALGAKVTALDKRNIDQFEDEVIGEMTEKDIKFILGESYLDDLTCFDVIFKTPSMRIDNPALVEAVQKGIYITSEMQEFVKYCPAKTYGVTGSDGKTTTTTIISEMLKAQGYKTWIGGNIGNPLFSKIKEIKHEDRVVLELSSFQLMTMDVSTNVALITNLSPNHLDMHKDMNEYIGSKKNIFKYQNGNDVLVLNEDNEITNSMTKEAKGKVIKFSLKENKGNTAYFKQDSLYFNDTKVCDYDEMKLKGMHNAANLLAAFCVVKDDVSVESMRKVATTFTGVEHRCEFVRTLDDVEYYNDSIASSPTRTLAGLMAFEKPVILISGGYDKNIPFEPLAEKGIDKIKTLILLGATKEKIKNAFVKVMDKKNKNLEIIMVETLEEAVERAKQVAKSGDIITLSPACASFDMFKNFEIRGRKFKEIVNELK